MPGPPPKKPAERRRRNKTGAKVLELLPGSGAGAGIEAPRLPAPSAGGEWHEVAVECWRSYWASPMAREAHDADGTALLMYLELVQAYVTERDPALRVALAREVRMARKDFGVTPLDRRRLQWEVERGEEAAARTTERRRSTPAARRDPRLRGA